jgi:hypothetical protein
MTDQTEEQLRQELLSLMKELASRYRDNRWRRGMDHLLWQMAHSGSTEDWPAERLPTDEQLRRLRDLSQRAGGWWARYDEDTIPEFVPLSIWRRHLVFSIVAIPLTFYLAWSFVLITTLFVAMFIPFSNPTWSPLVSWSVGILVGLFVLFWLVLCFSNWHRMFLCLLYPIHWLLTRRGLRIS